MPKFLIADDSEQILKLLATLLSQQEDWIVSGQAANGRQAVLMAHDLKPDFVILDLTMPMLSGLQATAEILKSLPGVPIILYTLHQSDQLDVEAKKVGARKVVKKTDSTDLLLKCIREILAPMPHTIAPADTDSNRPSPQANTSETSKLESLVSPIPSPEVA